MRRRIPAIAAAVAALLAGGCATTADAPLSPALGAAVASMQSQIIDPVPAKGLPETSGARAAASLARYDAGREHQPVTQSFPATGGDPAAPDEARRAGPGARP